MARPLDPVRQRLLWRRRKIRQRLREYADEWTDYMKMNRPWQDQTGDARRSLAVHLTEREIGDARSSFTLTFGYLDAPRVYYGHFLEHARAGQYAIVNPTARIAALYISTAIVGVMNQTGERLNPRNPRSKTGQVGTFERLRGEKPWP